MSLPSSGLTVDRWKSRILRRMNPQYGLILLAPVVVLYLVFWLYWSAESALQADFTGYFTAANIALRGLGGHLYDLELQRQIQSEFTFPYHFEIGGVLPFQYPPFAVLPFLPLARLPIRVAYYLWGGLNVGFFVATLTILSRSVPQLEKDPQLKRLLWLAAFGFLPFLSSLMLGQLSLLVLLAYVSGLSLLSRGREIEAGLVLAVVAVKPQLLVVTPIMLLLKGRWKALFGMVAGVCGLLALSVLLVGPFDVERFFEANIETVGWLPPTLNLTLFGFMSGLFQWWPEAILPSTLGAEALFLYLLWWGWKGEWCPAGPLFRLRIALLLLVSMAAAPHLYAHDLVLLVPVGFYVVDYLTSTEMTDRARVWAKLVGVVVFVTALIDSYPLLGWTVRPMFLAVVVVGGAILIALRKDPRARQTEGVGGIE